MNLKSARCVIYKIVLNSNRNLIHYICILPLKLLHLPRNMSCIVHIRSILANLIFWLKCFIISFPLLQQILKLLNKFHIHFPALHVGRKLGGCSEGMLQRGKGGKWSIMARESWDYGIIKGELGEPLELFISPQQCENLKLQNKSYTLRRPAFQMFHLGNRNYGTVSERDREKALQGKPETFAQKWAIMISIL